MRFLLFLISVLISSIAVSSQERKSLTMPYEGGTLTFQYYEKDGVKVPDGPMEFKKGNYTEKGENKDGFREGIWLATTVNKSGLVTAEFFYRNGLLEGTTSFKNTCIDINSKELYPEASYNFSKGRLYGKNKIIHDSDTIYCNFGDNGKWIGEWKIVSPEKTVVFEYDDESKIKDSYELDVLGQKKPAGVFLHKVTLSLLWLDTYFKEIPFQLRDKKRPQLPTLCEIKYGYLGSFDKHDKDNDW